MRGKAVLEPSAGKGDRITPAYAGKRPHKWRGHSLTTDHPRLCGEKRCRHISARSRRGSPPPMRGKDRHSFPRDSGWRITPAYAGKRRFAPVPESTTKDHPRLCGEKLRGALVKKALGGSPPPMRGKESFDPEDIDEDGITPAYAGKSPILSDVHEVSQDHPRLCGEKRDCHSVKFYPLGSPPPMRGKAPFQKICQAFSGITPAYAGKSIHKR